jgi:hypothetical protein
VPIATPDNQLQHVFLKNLNNNLRILTSISKKFQESLVKERRPRNNPDTQNEYQQGDFVLLASDSNMPRATKLTPKYAGPFEVISQTKNDVTAKHLASGVVKVLHVDKLKRFYGTAKDAKDMANIDQDQYAVKEIIGYRGNPTQRTGMQFGLLFEAGDIIWKYYCKDISDSVYFEDFCRSRKELGRLLTNESISKERVSSQNSDPIPQRYCNTSAYMNLRVYGYEKYSAFNLEDSDCRIYLAPISMGDLTTNGKYIWITNEASGNKFRVNHTAFLEYCRYKEVLADQNMFLIPKDSFRK